MSKILCPSCGLGIICFNGMVTPTTVVVKPQVHDVTQVAHMLSVMKMGMYINSECSNKNSDFHTDCFFASKATA